MTLLRLRKDLGHTMGILPVCSSERAYKETSHGGVFHMNSINGHLSRLRTVTCGHTTGNSASPAPAAAQTITTMSGGVRQTVSSTKPTSATAKSAGDFTDVVHSGL